MEVRSFSHKPLRRFYEEGETKGLPAGTAGKLRIMLAVLDQMNDAGELKAWPLWKMHVLTGNKKRHLEPARHAQLAADVSQFVAHDTAEIFDLNLEDYH